ncbi:DUF5320 domain-containing protein [Geofilum rhodophaeum]|uniref:DUF5320 domain-containing protein n=1 Tax=Geofilum rhodophaeum TaxID=1965019 RepID=UPI001314EC38|nr:DUF5320 domain-containing protein [Geofilum rhodophaeum]
MPGMDRTGPLGQGPRTGGQRGKCNSAASSVEVDRNGRGFGAGRGLGRGQGNGQGRGLGRGAGRGAGRGSGRNA